MLAQMLALTPANDDAHHGAYNKPSREAPPWALGSCIRHSMAVWALYSVFVGRIRANELYTGPSQSRKIDASGGRESSLPLKDSVKESRTRGACIGMAQCRVQGQQDDIG